MYDAAPRLKNTEPVAYMLELHPVNRSDDRFYMFAHCAEHEGWFIALAGKTGGALTWCQRHNYLFGILESCPDCGAEGADPGAEPAQDGTVTPRNTPVTG